MMKRFLFILISLLACMVASAKQVTESEALQKAQSFMQGKKFVMPEMSRRRAANNQIAPAYYVFNIEDQGGFVIVSGDDRMPEILGYSEKGNFDVEKVPCNVRWLLDSYEQAVKSLLQSDAKVSRRIEKTSREAISPFIATQWGQGSPYNDLCPESEWGRCVTGCVATAMAQVINYHRWPQGKTKSVAAYKTGVPNNFRMEELEPTQFNWDNMSSEDIARLMLYCGQSVHMNYQVEGSGAQLEDAVVALNDVFGYSRSLKLLTRSKYDEAEWDNIIYDEMSVGRPVIYSGSGIGSHSFILCGYKDEMYYVNWGWEGAWDGYFFLGNLVLEDGSDFTQNQTAIVSIQPPVGVDDTENPKAAILELSVAGNSFYRNSSSDDFPSLAINSKVVKEMTGETVEVGLGLYNESELLQVLSSEKHAFADSEVFDYRADVVFRRGLTDGHYFIRGINRYSDKGSWHADYGSEEIYADITIYDNDMILLTYPIQEQHVVLGEHKKDGVKYDLTFHFYWNNINFIALPITGDLKGDIYIPDSVWFSNIGARVELNGEFEYCPELTSLSLGKATDHVRIRNCPKLKTIEFREGVVGFGEISECPLLEDITYPSTMYSGELPSDCKNVKTISLTSKKQFTIRVFKGNQWDEQRMPALTDVYFPSDFPPKFEKLEGKMTANPNVTIHIPQGTLEAYQHSEWKDWKFVEDMPAIPIKIEWDYFGCNYANCGGFAIGRGRNDVEYAISVPVSTIEAYKGCKITQIEFYTEPLVYNDMGMSKVEYVFITKPGTDYLIKQPVNTYFGIWNTIMLPQPYEITGEPLYVGVGRNRALEFSSANLNVVDGSCYLRVMGDDTDYGMANEVGIWQNMAELGVDFNHPLPIRFIIEGDNLPTDVIVQNIDLVGGNSYDEEFVSKARSKRETTTELENKGYFTTQFKDPLEESCDTRAKVSARKVYKKSALDKRQIQIIVHSRTPYPVRSLKVDLAIDGKAIDLKEIETYLLPNHESQILIDWPTSIQGRNHDVTLDVSEIDGVPDAIKFNSSDSLSLSFPANTHFPRKVVMEECTGAWCGYCPRGIASIKQAYKTYPDNFLAIALHKEDEMYPSNKSYDGIIDQFEFVPNSFINRLSTFDPSWPQLWDIIFDLKDTGDAIITASAYFSKTDSTYVDVDTETIFGFDDNGSTKYSIAYVILEDSVGPYIQTNYYSDPFAEDDPDYWMNDWVHKDFQTLVLYNDVARAIYDDYRGTAGSVPEVITEGEKYSYHYSLRLPDNIQNKKNIRVATLLIDGYSGEILNADCTKVVYDPEKASGIAMPCLSETRVFDIYSINGVKIRNKATSLDDLPKGIYIINGKKVVVK